MGGGLVLGFAAASPLAFLHVVQSICGASRLSGAHASASARRSSPEEPGTVARAKAASERRRITRGAMLQRVLAVTVAGVALYGLAPKLGAVLGAWPRLLTSSQAGSR